MRNNGFRLRPDYMAIVFPRTAIGKAVSMAIWYLFQKAPEIGASLIAYVEELRVYRRVLDISQHEYVRNAGSTNRSSSWFFWVIV